MSPDKRHGPFCLPPRWQSALESLAGRPLFLVCVLLAVNAVALPYRGLDHDARLYAAQVTERLDPGSLSEDLYLRYGSQDSYSIFSVLLVPLARLVGLQPAFFLAYLLSKVLLFAALTRLTTKLLPDRLSAVLALLLLALAPLPFGGSEVYHVNEAFLTPRIAASALVLFALERALSGKPLQAAGLVVLGMAVHPVMAFAGGLVLALWALFARASWRVILLTAAAVALAGAVVVFYQPLGGLAFGRLDENWRSVVYHVCFFADPATWTLGDWLRIAAAVAAAAAFVRLFGRQYGPLVAALIVAGLMGVAGNLAAAHVNYRLLTQASPYRTLWLLETLAVPLAVAVAVRLWGRAPWGPLTAVVVAALVTADWNQSPAQLVLVVASLVVRIVWQRGLRREPAREAWAARAAARALIAAAAVLLLSDGLLVAALLRQEATLDVDLHPVRVAQSAGAVLCKLPLLALVVAGLASREWRGGVRMGAAFAAAFLLYQGVIASLDASDAYQARYSVRQRHVQYVSGVLHERGREMGRTPCVYWTTDLRDTWFRGRSSAYFNSVQLSGCAFNRGTAIEGRRRATLVRAFEADELRRHPVPYRWWQEALEAFYDASNAHRPDEGDLFALCADECVDFVIVTHRFDGLYCSTDGVYYVYDCSNVRQIAKAREEAQRTRVRAATPSPRSPRP